MRCGSHILIHTFCTYLCWSFSSVEVNLNNAFPRFVNYCSAVAWQLTLNPPEKKKEVEGDVGYSKEINSLNSDLSILIFRSLISSEKAVNIHLVLLMKPLSYDVYIAAFLLFLDVANKIFVPYANFLIC